MNQRRARLEELIEVSEIFTRDECHFRDTIDADDVLFLLSEIDTLQGALKRIISMAGHPDASQGCRNIIGFARKALGEEK